MTRRTSTQPHSSSTYRRMPHRKRCSPSFSQASYKPQNHCEAHNHFEAHNHQISSPPHDIPRQLIVVCPIRRGAKPTIICANPITIAGGGVKGSSRFPHSPSHTPLSTSTQPHSSSTYRRTHHTKRCEAHHYYFPQHYCKSDSHFKKRCDQAFHKTHHSLPLPLADFPCRSASGSSEPPCGAATYFQNLVALPMQSHSPPCVSPSRTDVSFSCRRTAGSVKPPGNAASPFHHTIPRYSNRVAQTI
jgi:hypothetical protein